MQMQFQKATAIVQNKPQPFNRIQEVGRDLTQESEFSYESQNEMS
jgi:hypothetical protein